MIHDISLSALRWPDSQGSHSDWKAWKMGRHFPVKEESRNLKRLEKSGKITQNTGKLREFQKNYICYFPVSVQGDRVSLVPCPLRGRVSRVDRVQCNWVDNQTYNKKAFQ